MVRNIAMLGRECINSETSGGSIILLLKGGGTSKVFISSPQSKSLRKTREAWGDTEERPGELKKDFMSFVSLPGEGQKEESWGEDWRKENQ